MKIARISLMALTLTVLTIHTAEAGGFKFGGNRAGNGGGNRGNGGGNTQRSSGNFSSREFELRD